MELLPGTERALLHRVAVAQAEGRAPSMVAGVVRDGELVWWGARGRLGVTRPGGDPGDGADGRPPDVRTAYRIGSVTKTFTAVLVLRLREEGLLALTDPIERHVAGTGLGAATVGQLLAHVAGTAAEPPGPWWERTPGDLRPDLPDVLGADPVRHPTGLRFHYSNPGYAVLGALVERLRDGRPWADVLRAEVLEPLGLSETGVRPSGGHADGWAVHPWADVLLPEPAEDYGPMAPAGQLWSTVADLARFGDFLMSGHDDVLGSEAVAELRRPVAPPEGPDPRTGYGLGLQVWQRDGRMLAGHGGSVPGFLATLWVCPQECLGAVVLTNTTAGVAVGEVAADLIGIVAEREPRIPPQWRPASDPELLGLAGLWYWGPAPFTLRVREGRTMELTSMNGSRAARLRPEPDGTWRGLDGYFAGETLRVVRDGGGAVTHLDMGTFVFTRAPYDPDAPVPGGVDPAGWRTG